MKKYFIILVLLFVSSNVCSASNKIIDYGFENWGGGISSTPGYPFSSSYAEYCQSHEDGSEVIRSYQDWTPHTGNYFFMRNDGGGSFSPSIPGISSGTVNDNGNIGMNGSSCSQSPIDFERDINTGEIFISFWARIDDSFGRLPSGGRCKWIRVQTDGGVYGTVYMHIYTKLGSNDSRMYFYNGDEGGFLDDGLVTPLVNAFDGNWHKYSLYINFNSGLIRGWYDVDRESSLNVSREWQAPDGKIGSSSRPSYFLVQANFSADSPNELTYHALDDIQVWDGMPNTDGVISPVISPPTDETIDETIDVQAWNAEEQTGQTGWSDSTSTWCVRVPVNGSSIVNSGNQVKIEFNGRNSGDYRIKEVSIAERDANGGVGAVVDSTWTKVTFSGASIINWGTAEVTVPAGGDVVSDPVTFNIQSGKDYYVTYMLVSPSVYLCPSTDQSELYFSGADRSNDIDWTGFSTQTGRLHALSKIYVGSCGPVVPMAGVGLNNTP
ncbi:MAG: hypothetical protein KKG99_06400 [Bacteroidetes bacterium]|nr:hypothetical protein [Bacteroidota bacterium]